MFDNLDEVAVSDAQPLDADRRASSALITSVGVLEITVLGLEAPRG